MRALMTATVPSMIGQFNMENIKILLELGYEVDVACDFKDFSVWSEEKVSQFISQLEEKKVKVIHVDFTRNLCKLHRHFKAYLQIKKLTKENGYSIIHTHTPISSLIVRLACKKLNTCKMIYTAHGFHFFEGNSYLKNIFFRKIEKIAAKYTDILITINKEDYNAAKKFKIRDNGSVIYIPGVGIDIQKIQKERSDTQAIKRTLGINDGTLVLISIGELNSNKNHEAVLRALQYLQIDFHYLICGKGVLREYLEEVIVELGLQSNVHLLGYREDVLSLLKCSDLFLFPSKREGLPVSVMEAMACGLPCVVSDIRGNRDLIVNTKGGILIKVDDFTSQLINVLNSKDLKRILESMGSYNLLKSKEYDKSVINEIMEKIYEK